MPGVEPPPPAGEDDLLVAAAARGAPLDRAEAGRLAIHATELRRFGRTLSLVGPGAAAALLDHHYMEALLARELLPAGGRLLDIGSGAGFPGLVLAAVRPDLEVHLVEPNPRKAAFLRVASRRMGVAARVHACRVEALPAGLGGVGVVTSRALRLTPAMMSSLAPRLLADARLLLWVGRELSLPAGWRVAGERALPGSDRRRIVTLIPVEEAP